jgi:transposase InsO family protein
VKFSFIKDHCHEFDVKVMCRVFDVSRGGYYLWLDRPEGPRARRACELAQQITKVHHEVKGVYGSIKITRELRRRNHHVNRKTVARLMQALGIKSKVCRKFRVQTTDSNHSNPIAPNKLNQNFDMVTGPNQCWGADITYIATGEGFLYLAGIMDLYSRKIVGWSTSETMATELVERAMTSALQSRKASSGLLHHSDRGVQYTSARYRELLEERGIELSMSRKGNCYDNAVVESFWGKLKTEMVNHTKFETKDEARRAIFEYVEMFYNRKRLHAALGYVSPVEFEEGCVR